MLIRKKLTADEFSSPYLRYSEDCDCVQFTPDGGETWIDQPSNDPRTSDAYRLPALSGGDAQCRAAEGMTALVRAIVDQRIETDTAIELAGGILGIVSFIPGFNVLWALILALASFAVTIAREILEAAFTEADYDQLRCIFYCRIDSTGQMDQEAFDLAYADLIDMNAIARTWVQNVMQTFGPVGMSDAGVRLEAAADCDECECEWCVLFDFTLSDCGFTADTYGTWESGRGWVSTTVSGLSQAMIVYKIWTATTIKSYSSTQCFDVDGSGTGAGRYVDLRNGATILSSATGDALIGCQDIGHTGTWTADRILVNPSAAMSSGNIVMQQIVIRGVGEKPTGGEDCPL